jgi:hypothetical protein
MRLSAVFENLQAVARARDDLCIGAGHTGGLRAPLWRVSAIDFLGVHWRVPSTPQNRTAPVATKAATGGTPRLQP